MAKLSNPDSAILARQGARRKRQREIDKFKKIHVHEGRTYGYSAHYKSWFIRHTDTFFGTDWLPCVPNHLRAKQK